MTNPLTAQHIFLYFKLLIENGTQGIGECVISIWCLQFVLFPFSLLFHTNYTVSNKTAVMDSDHQIGSNSIYMDEIGINICIINH